jgi:hypothetical protein
MNERGVSRVSPLASAAGTTTARAKALSAALIKDAIAFINQHLADAEWVRANRRIHQGIAVWSLLGNNLLTVPERAALEASYSGEDWHSVAVTYEGQNETANWRITFQLQ